MSQTVAKGLKRLRKEKATFNTMTELADKLLNTGDYGIYSTPKEDLEDAIDAVRDSRANATGAGAAALAAAAAAAGCLRRRLPPEPHCG